MIWVLFGGFVLLLALNIPVAYAMLTVSVGYLVWKWDIPFIVVAQQLGAGTDQFLLLSIPFFYLAGEFMAHGGITQRLVDLARALVGHFRGGLGHVTVISSMLFSGISGSAVADMAALGKIEIGMMRAGGYPLGFAAAIKSAAATLGPIIPPSIPLVVYGSLTDTSVGKLFLAGFVPGFLMTVFLMAAVTVIATRRDFPRSAWLGWRVLALKIYASIPVLMLPVIILGGIFGGFFTPTEAAIVSAAYALVAGVIIGDLRLVQIPAILVKVAVESGQIMIILACAALFSWILAREGIPRELASLALSYHTEPWMFLLAVNVLLLFLGGFMETIPILVIVVPVLLPIVKALAIDPVHFGVMVSLNLMLGLIHPPIGMLMFIVMSMTKISMEEFVRETWPFLIALIAALVVVTYCPDFVLTVPRYFYN